jgi:hypothetical protein
VGLRKEFTLLSVWDAAHSFFRGQFGWGQGQGFLLAAPGDTGKFRAETQLIQLFADVLGGGLACGTVVLANTVGVLKKLARQEFGFGKAIGVAVEHVLDRDQQFAGDRNDGLVASQARFETLEFGDPVRVGIAGGLCGFHQGGA